MSITFRALMGFALERRLKLLSSILAAILVAGGSYAIGYSLLTMELCTGAFQITAFASIVVVRFARVAKEDSQFAAPNSRREQSHRGIHVPVSR